ncbi:MAG: hypothetical protein JW776_03330 [Candidatus Lokiarchaeota archaeon]|nr:hypothetical protein [Candidatus Lokiarchaeota archaeon]
MVRESWMEIYPYYQNYIQNMLPLFEQSLKFVQDLQTEQISENTFIMEYLAKEEKRSVGKVKAISEFSALYRRDIFSRIWDRIEELKVSTDLEEIRDLIIDDFEEAIEFLDFLGSLTTPDQTQYESTNLYQIVNFIQEQIFPKRTSLQEVYDHLIEKSLQYYEIQRHLLMPTSSYREKDEGFETPALHSNHYKLINEITSLFNLDPNYLESPKDPNLEIPVILKDEIFLPFIDSIASNESINLNHILKRMELQLIHNIFIGPTMQLIRLGEPHNYFRRESSSETKERIIPQLSNETLVLMYLAKISYKRGFISKELINWISSIVAVLVYNGTLFTFMSEENIFYTIFTDLKTEEKILPYMMKLICFDKYLGIDRTKIRDSVQYRKEIFGAIGSQIIHMKKLIEEVSNYIFSILEE